jgi:hypothetical protein
MIKVLENYDVPSYDPRRPAIMAWRDGMSPSERAKLNHPKRVWSAYWAKTTPQAEKEARAAERAMQEPSADPMLDLVADTERERDDAHRHAQDGRGLLGEVLERWEDIPADLREKIERHLGS